MSETRKDPQTAILIGNMTPHPVKELTALVGSMFERMDEVRDPAVDTDIHRQDGERTCFPNENAVII